MTPTPAPKKLYHISHIDNTGSIADLGINPQFSQTAASPKRAYAVEDSWVGWALAHCSVRHDVKVANLAIWQIDYTHIFRKFNYGIWYTTQAVKSRRAWLASEYLERQELNYITGADK